MQVPNKIFKEPLYLIGVGFIVVSYFLFLLPVLFPDLSIANEKGIFLVNISFTIIYFTLLLVKGRLKQGRNGIHHVFVLLVMGLISAYALNREMVVFEKSVPWFAAFIAISAINLLLFVFFDSMPQWARFLTCMIAGLGMLLFFYLSTYLIPLYPVSIAAFFVLGISLHSFIPLLLCIYIIFLMKRLSVQTKKYWLPFSIGIVLPLAFTIYYIISWNKNLEIINETHKYASITENNQLPSWVSVAQRTPKNEQTEKLLKSDLVYSVPHFENRSWLWSSGSSNFESKAHDPLVMTSALFCGPINVPQAERINILETLYDSRHEAEQRLWSGKDLITEEIITHVDVWPALRIAYSELNIIVGDNGANHLRTNTQEAIYTFHLPEGAVVTSLSLWIDGMEEKGILTTKSKADSAYKTIVGVERRDPSVIHWQEGNTVSVRVFPIMKGQSRKFKIGVTSPLSYSNDKLYYQNIYFDGPSFSTDKETVSVALFGSEAVESLPKDFIHQGNIITKNKAAYSSTWALTFPAPALSSETFSFNDYSYSTKPIQQFTEDFEPQRIYLDINEAWSLQECNAIFESLQDKKLYVASGKEKLTKLTPSNKQALFEVLLKNNFSLFPFYKITDDSTALVVSKTGALSPTIDDLRNSAYLASTKSFFASGKQVKLFNLSMELSPYLKSLKEFRMLQYDQGDVNQLKALLAARKFTRTVEDDNEIPIYNAGISLQRMPLQDSGKGPDHLMRLYAYNHILQRSGAAILDDELNEAALIEEAQEAYIVSPFSSLIVLETQKDYDRFNIAASKNSLQNASATSNGAVPEPHEWALIFLVLIFITVVKFRPGLLVIKR